MGSRCTYSGCFIPDSLRQQNILINHFQKKNTILVLTNKKNQTIRQNNTFKSPSQRSIMYHIPLFFWTICTRSFFCFPEKTKWPSNRCVSTNELWEDHRIFFLSVFPFTTICNRQQNMLNSLEAMRNEVFTIHRYMECYSRPREQILCWHWKISPTKK